MKKLSLLIVVLSLFGISTALFAKTADSIEEMTGRDGETCSIMLSDTGETAVKEEIAGEVDVLQDKKQIEVPVEK